MKNQIPFCGFFNFCSSSSAMQDSFSYSSWHQAIKETEQQFSRQCGPTNIISPYGHETISYINPSRKPPQHSFRHYIYIQSPKEMTNAIPKQKKDIQELFVKILQQNLTEKYPDFFKKPPLITVRDETSQPIARRYHGNSNPTTLIHKPNFINIYFKQIPQEMPIITHYNRYIISTLEAVANYTLPEFSAMLEGSKLSRNRIFQLFVLHSVVVGHLLKLPQLTSQEEQIFLLIFKKLRDRGALEELIPNHTPPLFALDIDDIKILNLISNRTQLMLSRIQQEPGVTTTFETQAYHDSNTTLISTINESFLIRWLQILEDSYNSFVAITREAQHNSLPKPR